MTHEHGLVIETLYYAPAWIFFVTSSVAFLSFLSLALRWRSFIMTRWEVALVCVSLAGVVFFDAMVTFTGVDDHTLIAVSRAMRVILSLSIFWISHVIIIRQRRLGHIKGWWK